MFHFHFGSYYAQWLTAQSVSVYMHIQRDGSSPVQGVSAVDQYSHSVSMISSSSPLSVCGRRVGGCRENERAQEKRDGSQMEGGREIPEPAVAQRNVFTINLKHTLPLHTHLYTETRKGTVLDSERDKE